MLMFWPTDSLVTPFTDTADNRLAPPALHWAEHSQLTTFWLGVLFLMLYTPQSVFVAIILLIMNDSYNTSQ